MNRKTLTGILIIIAIFLLSEQFIWKRGRIATTKTRQNEQVKPDEIQSPKAESSASSEQEKTVLIPNQSSPGLNEQLILENDSLKVVFSNKGAVIKQIYLKNHFLSDKSEVQLIPEGKNLLNTVLLSESGSDDLKNVMFSHDEIEINGQKGLRFYVLADTSVAIEKTFVLDNRYGLKLNIRLQTVKALLGYSLDFASGIKDTEEYLKAKGTDYWFFIQVDNSLVKKSLQQLNKSSLTLNGKTEWAAIRSKYFVIACRDIEPVLSNSVKADTSAQSPAFTIITKREKASHDWDEDYLLYMGPADVDILKSHSAGMADIAERGAKWLRWLSGIFSWFLSFLYKLIPNYGIVIIVFSIVLKIVLHPFTHKSMDASLKMQKIQPKVQALQHQFKNDPKRLQQELAKLYKEAGASPLGGCLPLLLQMPVFIALYSVLRYSLDMRQAHFIGWLKDLSEPDPIYVLPILMGVFMLIQSLMMNPKKQQLEQMDEKQKAMQSSQKMMAWVMPGVLFFVFRSMPAGLVLYWTVFNILSIIQQYYLQKHLNKKET